MQEPKMKKVDFYFRKAGAPVRRAEQPIELIGLIRLIGKSTAWQGVSYRPEFADPRQGQRDEAV